MRIKKMARENVAIYWDFENIHASLYDERYGEGSYRESKGAIRSEVIDLDIVASYASNLGEISIHRAYGNWANFYQYRRQFLTYSVDLIQLFGRGSYAKNGADIRIVLDVMEDLVRFPHITHVLIIGGDSDYVGLAQKVRQLGRFIAGVGVENYTNAFWARSCNEFKYYRTLVARTNMGASSGEVRELDSVGDLEGFKDLLLRTIRSGQNWENGITGAGLGALISRHDPTFDPANYGSHDLTELLRASNKTKFADCC